MRHQHGVRSSTKTKVYCPVVYRRQSGALLVTEDSVSFHSEDTNGERIVGIGWPHVKGITANVAGSPNALLKLNQVSSSKPLMFQMDSRQALEEAKRDIKARWKEAHDMSMVNYDDEDFDVSESRRMDGDDFYDLDNLRVMAPPQPASNRSKEAPQRTVKLSKAKSERISGQNSRQQKQIRRASTSDLPVFENRESMRKKTQHVFTKEQAHTSSESTSYNSANDHGHHHAGFSKQSQIQLLPNDQILLPRLEETGHLLLDFFDYHQRKGVVEISFMNNGEKKTTHSVKLEEALRAAIVGTSKDEEEALNNDGVIKKHDVKDDGYTYHISKRVCRISAAAMICLSCLFVAMTAALTVVSILLWQERNAPDSGEGTINLWEDDFYADYFSQYPPPPRPP